MDTLFASITILIPTFLIFIICMILYQKIKYTTFRSSRRNYSNNSNSTDSSVCKKETKSVKTAYIIVILSKWFVIFHLPYFVCWLFLHIHMIETSFLSNIFTIQTENKKFLLKACLNLFEILFSFNYAINFLSTF